MLPLEAMAERAVQETYKKLHQQALERLGPSADAKIISERFAGLRYFGQWHYVPITLLASETPDQLYERFETQHEILFGTRIGIPVEIVDIGVTVIQPRERDLTAYLARSDWTVQEEAVENTRLVMHGGISAPVPVYVRGALSSGAPLTGPCLVEEPQTVTYVPDGSVGCVTPEGYLSITVGEAVKA